MAKERLDVLLVERGLAASRERARTMIMEGRVLVDGKKVEKAGTGVKPEAELRLLGEEMPYVSRGGLKLEKALRAFSISLAGKTMADIGASTGGFTDCALQNGAARVYAIDVAFISLAKVLPAVRSLLKPQGEVAALIKPQFEAGRENVGKKGVVRDPHVHETVIRDVFRAAQEAGFCIRALSYSPVKGPEGNIEYLMHLVGTGEESAASGVSQEEIVAVVAEAHTELDK